MWVKRRGFRIIEAKQRHRLKGGLRMEMPLHITWQSIIGCSEERIKKRISSLTRDTWGNIRIAECMPSETSFCIGLWLHCFVCHKAGYHLRWEITEKRRKLPF